MFVAARAVPPDKGEHVVVLAFVIDNGTDEELPVSSVGFQASTLAGIQGEYKEEHAKHCLGFAAPHGRFVCQVLYRFHNPESELRVRALGLWFRVRVEESDAGNPAAAPSVRR